MTIDTLDVLALRTPMQEEIAARLDTRHIDRVASEAAFLAHHQTGVISILTPGDMTQYEVTLTRRDLDAIAQDANRPAYVHSTGRDWFTVTVNHNGFPWPWDAGNPPHLEYIASHFFHCNDPHTAVVLTEFLQRFAVHYADERAHAAAQHAPIDEPGF